jgi:hypothetical protein
MKMVSQNAKMDEFCRNSHAESSILGKASGKANDEDSFPISAILDSLRLVDVTEDKAKRDAAFKLTIEMYSKLSSGGIDSEQMYRDLCQDKYLRQGLARIFVLEGLNPVSMKVDILGTIRVVLGSEAGEDTDVMPLEAMELVSPGCGWRAFRFEDFNIKRSVEMGRFAILPECRNAVARRHNLHLTITRKLVRGAYRFAAQHYGKSQVWAIMARHAAMIVQTSGIPVKRAPGISLKVKENKTLFETFDRYWLKGHPAFYKVLLS